MILSNKIVRVLFSCVVMICSSGAVAQNRLDSLLQARAVAAHDTLRIQSDLEIGNSLYTVNWDSAQFYFERALNLAEAISSESPAWVPKALMSKGDALTASDLDDEAIATFKQAIDISKERGLKKEQSNAQFGLGYAYMSKSDFKTAILHYDSVVVRNESEGTGYSMADCLNFSGLCNFYIRKLDIASEKALAAIRYRREVGDTAYIHNPYMVYALVLYEQEDYEGAKVYLKKVAYNARAVNDLRRVRLAYENLSFVLLDQDSTDAAIKNMTAAWEISKETNYEWGSVRYFNMVGEIEIDRGNYQLGHDYIKKSIDYIKPSVAPQSKGDIYLDLARAKIILADSVYATSPSKRRQLLREAVPLAEEGWELASQVNSANVMLDAAQVLAVIYSNLNRYKEAFEYSQKAKSISEEINDKARTGAIARMTTEYETELVEAQNESLRESQKAQAARIEQQNFMLFGGAVGLLLVAVSAAVIYRSRLKLKKANQTIEKSLSEKELLLKEIHHRVKNNLQVVSSLLDLQSRGIEDEEALATFMEGQNRVKAMALIHQKLYQNENLATINFEEYARLLMTELGTIYQRSNEVKTEVNAGSESDFDIDVALPLGLILNELISNAYKYAFEAGREGALAVSIQSLGEGKHQLVVEDNGAGLPENFDFARAKSLGLRLVRRLAKQLYGSVTYTGHKGARFVVIFTNTIERKTV
ncbi:MAG: hypothetical protein Roseis2KO_30830 [Roseivirga sp.]